MWAVERFEQVQALTAPRKRLGLDAADRVLETLCRRNGLKAGPDDGMGIRTLIGQAAWERLAPAIRERFGNSPARGEVRVYRGVMETVGCTWLGLAMAHVGRFLGAPMAWKTGRDVPCDVHVYADPKGGVVWERRYDFGAADEIVAKTTKRCDGRGRLLECFGTTAGMTLKVFEQDAELHFVSEDFFLRIANWKVLLPAALSPGTLHVVQKDEGEGNFRFTMDVEHPMFGTIATQDGVFRRVMA
ncbi:MAG: DUF4166 domain-containing protein [Rhizobiales bacterium]|nr:DUF4166 domain-containing protein [Hyphomicrobiales bacterium]